MPDTGMPELGLISQIQGLVVGAPGFWPDATLAKLVSAHMRSKAFGGIAVSAHKRTRIAV